MFCSPAFFSNGAKVVTPLPSMLASDFTASPANASASIAFGSDGSIGYTGIGSSGPTKWYNPLQLGIGSSYWVKMVPSTGSNPTSGTVNTWIALSSNPFWSWVTSGGAPRYLSGTGTIYISTSASDAGIISSGAYDVDVQKEV